MPAHTGNRLPLMTNPDSTHAQEQERALCSI